MWNIFLIHQNGQPDSLRPSRPHESRRVERPWRAMSSLSPGRQVHVDYYIIFFDIT